MTRSGDEVLLGIRALASFAVGYGLGGLPFEVAQQPPDDDAGVLALPLPGEEREVPFEERREARLAACPVGLPAFGAIFGYRPSRGAEIPKPSDEYCSWPGRFTYIPAVMVA